MEVAGAAVIPQPLPEFQHLIFGGLGQQRHPRESLREAQVIVHPLLDTGLLEDDLREPDAVGIARLAPREGATMAAVPGNEGRSNRMFHQSRIGRSGRLVVFHHLVDTHFAVGGGQLLLAVGDD